MIHKFCSCFLPFGLSLLALRAFSIDAAPYAHNEGVTYDVAGAIANPLIQQVDNLNGAPNFLSLVLMDQSASHARLANWLALAPMGSAFSVTVSPISVAPHGPGALSVSQAVYDGVDPIVVSAQGSAKAASAIKELAQLDKESREIQRISHQSRSDTAEAYAAGSKQFDAMALPGVGAAEDERSEASLAVAEPIYKNPAAPVEARVEDLLGRMTLDEKIDQLSGVNDMDLRPNARLQIPSLKMADGPLGVRLNSGEKMSAFPAGIMMAASFDTELLGRVATAMAEEALAAGRDMLLGPCINIARVPQGGRNFESYGEDPYLAAQMAQAYVKALQGKKVLASAKHYALNNQEIHRTTIDVRATERTMHEIYLPAFEAAVGAGVWSIMASYNKVNGHYASENNYLLNEVLKNLWGFKGFVVSDWGAANSTVEAASGGLDVEMPSGDYFGGGKLQRAIAEGKVPVSAIDEKVRRVLRAMIAGGVFDRRDSDRPSRTIVGSPEHRAVALEMAQEGIVLLKNDGILPLEKIKSVAVIGPNAAEYRSGGGSSQVPPISKISLLDAVRQRAGPEVAVRFAQGVAMQGEIKPFDAGWLAPPHPMTGHGLYAEYFNNKELQGKPVVTQIDPLVNFRWGDDPLLNGVNTENVSIRWAGRLRVPETANYAVAVKADDGARLWIDGKLVINDWNDHAARIASADLRLESGRDYDIKLEYYNHTGDAWITLGRLFPVNGRIPEAVDAASRADAAIVVVGVYDQLEGEGIDREHLMLPENQEELIHAVAQANKNVVVVLEAGSPILMGSWAKKARAIVEAWYPGQEGALAVADVLLGSTNPSGKLPVTFPKRWEDSAAFGNYPGATEPVKKLGAGKNVYVNYAEGISVGYRHFDYKGIEPEFPFGHGLSYTTFQYKDLSARLSDSRNDRQATLAKTEPLSGQWSDLSMRTPAVLVSLNVANSGKRKGTEVVQLYVSEMNPKAQRPPQELKGFQRVSLAPGETKRISFMLDKRAFAYYDEDRHAWAVAPGRFEIRIGSSSRDIRLKQEITLP